jgi:hypothetical protein
MSNPWICQSPPCVPDDKVIPSYKFSIRTRSTFTVGTAGVGFFVMAPRKFGNDFSVASNYPLYHSSAAYTGTTIACSTGVTGCIGSNHSRFPYTISQIGKDLGDIQIRVVGAGARVFYTGTELNRGGTLLAFRQPENTSVYNAAAADLYSYNNTRSVACDRRKHAVCWVPVSPYDYAYSEDSNNYSSVTQQENNSGPCCMGFMVTGATAGNTFEYETIIHYEAIGTLLNSTKSHSDAAGLSAVHTAIPRVIETISSVFSKEVITGAYKAIEMASGLYFGPSAQTATKTLEYVLSRPTVEEL